VSGLDRGGCPAACVDAPARFQKALVAEEEGLAGVGDGALVGSDHRLGGDPDRLTPQVAPSSWDSAS